MFGRKKIRSEIESLQKQIGELSPQPQSQIFWDKIGSGIRLFDFDNSFEIHRAIKLVPELASVLNYLGKSFSAGILNEYSNNEIVENSSIVKFMQRPHQLYGGSEFMQTFAEMLFAFGRVHIYCDSVTGFAEDTKSMFIMPSWNVDCYTDTVYPNDVLTNAVNLIKYYEFTFEGIVYQIPKEKVITVTSNTRISFCNRYLIFESPLKPLQDALLVTPSIYNSMQNLNSNLGMTGFVANRSTDSGSYMPIEPKEKEIIQKELKKYGTKTGQNHLAFVNYDLKYVPISSPIKDMFLPEQQKMIKIIIADIFGFDTAILNNSDANKYSNYNEARKSMFTEIIIPTANNYTDALNNYFFKYKPSNRLELNYSSIDVFAEDEKTKIDKINSESLIIINLNKSVSLGEMTRDNAVNFLIYNGYDKIIANSLIA